jgi:hypothetical protein
MCWLEEADGFRTDTEVLSKELWRFSIHAMTGKFGSFLTP